MMGKFNFILIAVTLISLPALRAEEKPNFVIIFADDQGYGDLGCFGSTTIKTPNIDHMATEGRRFTNFMVASPVCTPSRAALLTGCYPKRVGMHQHVLFPQSTKGLNPEEHTIADHLKAQGYATACFGKWHLGHHPETLPQQNGFDTYFGIPYSNDMNHPDNKGKPTVSSDDLWKDQESTLTLWQTPLMENAKIVELPVDQRTVTRRYTDRAVEFITTNKDKPFFVYLPHSMPHIPLYVPEDVYDPDPKNAYINVIEHIDAEVGRVLNTIRDLNLADNTYVIYTSDNGPWLRFGTHGGSAGPLRDGKGTTFEGGQRVPCVMWAPGKIPAGSECPDLVGTIDLLPTIAAITESPLPEGKKIDGLNISAAIHGSGESPRKKFIYYTSRGALEGIRVDQWKLLVKTPADKRGKGKGKGQQSGATPKIETLLFNLDSDMEESNNVAGAHPEIVKRLTAQMQEYDAEITENARAPWEKPE
ncbi:MAG: sulfatase [Verrucomicrobiales bacterium]|nr:sulfatase [Verrucomicrobiales bacterium]